MKSWMFGVVGMGLLTFGSGAAQTGKMAATKGWHTSLEEARAAAGKNGKPLMVVFRCEP